MIAAWRKYRIYLVVLGFAVWVTFLDRNNLVNLIKYKRELSALREKEAYYKQEIEKMKADKKLIFSSDESLETFAREKYLMKKDNEDLYIIKKE